jgi:hypothetical protein
MGLGGCVAKWVVKLHRNKVLPNGRAMLELGPQDIALNEQLLKGVLADRFGAEQAQSYVQELLQKPPPIPARLFYSYFGISEYYAIDGYDARATWIGDLNFPIKVGRQFDVVTNIGTAEHVFNIAEVFRTADALCRDDGVILHVLPSFGGLNHGFYNIHPTVYFDLARQNHYKIEDFTYVDNFEARNSAMNSQGYGATMLEDLPIKLDTLQQTDIADKIAEQFIANLKDPVAATMKPRLRQDYCLVAFRKMGRVSDSPFKYPFQGSYSVPPLYFGDQARR